MVRERLGLNQPLVLRYVSWLDHAVHGDLGTSSFNSVKVRDAAMERLPLTLSLTAASAVIAMVVGLATGLATVL
jgi:peptide/nickel transport system permease protein